MAEPVSVQPKTPSKLESLPKEDLLKLLKKQANNTKDLKKKLEELGTALKTEKNENVRLENEMKEWISHGVTAEFEKKNKITKKEQELELAAQLGKEMLAENDTLQIENKDLQREFEDSVKGYEDELDRMMQDKMMLEETLQSMQNEYKSAKQEVLDNKEALKFEREENETVLSSLQQDIKELKSKNKTLNDNASSHNSTSSTKIKKVREKLDDTMQENETLKQSLSSLKKENKDKSEKMLLLDQEMKTLRNEILELQQQKKVDVSEMEDLKQDREAMLLAVKESDAQTKLLDEELLKTKGEKEKLQKSLKTLKTKSERGVQMEEELRKQLGTIVGERDDLMKKLQKASKSKSKGKHAKSPREDGTSRFENQIKQLQDEILQLREENSGFKSTPGTSEDVPDEKYQALEKDVNDLSFELNEVSSVRDRLNEEKNELNTINTSLTEDKQSLQERFKDLQQVYEQCLLEKDSVVCQLSVLKVDLQTHKETSEELSTKLQQLEKKDGKKDENKTEQDEETKATILKLESRIDELVNQLQRLNEEKLYQETEFEELFKSQDDLLNKYDFECQERERAEKQIRELEDKLSQHENSGNNESQEDKSLDELKETIHHLEESVAEVTRSCDQYKQEVLIKEECVQQLRKEIEEVGRKSWESNNMNNKEVDKIVNEVRQLDEQLNNTREDLHEVTQQNTSLTDLNRSLEHDKSELESSYFQSSQSAEELRESYTTLQKQFSELEQQLSVKKQEEEEIEGMKNECLSLNARVKELENEQSIKNEHTVVEGTARVPEDQIERLKDECISLSERNKELENELALKNNDLCISAEEVDRVKNELQQLHSQCRELGEKGNECVTEVDREVINNGELDHLKQQLQEKDEAIEALKGHQVNESTMILMQKITDRFTSVENLQTELNELENLKESLSKKDHTIENLQAGLTELEQLRENISTKNDEIESLSKQIENKDNVSSITEEYNNVMQEKDSILNQLNDLKQEHLNLREAYQEVRAELAKLKTTEENYVNESHEKQTIISKLNEEIASLKSKDNEIEQLNVEVDQLRVERVDISELNAEISLLKDSLDDSTHLLDEKCMEVEHLHHEVDHKETSFAVITGECSALNLTLEESKNHLTERDDELLLLTKSYECLQGDKQSLEMALENLQKQNDQLTETVSGHDHESQNLQSLYEEKSQLVDSLRQALSNEVDKATVIEELEQHKIANERIESELQSAFNRIEELEIALKESSQQIKDKTDKGVKLRNVALKAKKEMESMRNRINEEKNILEGQITVLMEEGKTLKNELVQQKTACSKHEEEFEEMRKEIEGLQEQLEQANSTHTETTGSIGAFEGKIDSLTLSNSKMESRVIELEQSNADSKITMDTLSRDKESSQSLLDKKTKECEEITSKLESVEKALGNAQKNSNQMNVMNLEIDDYLKTIENLNEKLQSKEAQCVDLLAMKTTVEEKQKSSEEEIDLIKKGKSDVEEKNRKMKNMIIKLKKELSEMKSQAGEYQNKETSFNQRIEELSHEIEDLKMQVSNSVREREKMQIELQQKLDMQLKAYQTLEVKFARSHSDMTSSQKSLVEMKEEYENYKVRAHNVLKQQKENGNNAVTEKHQEEVERLESMITQLRTELSTIQNELKVTNDEHEQLEIEYEKQQGLQGEFIKEMGEKEDRWKSRFRLIKSESDTKDVDHEKKVKLLIGENNKLLQYTKDQMEDVKTENELFSKQIESLKKELKESKSRQSTSSSSSSSSSSNDDGKLKEAVVPRMDSRESKTSHLSLEFSKSTMERQEGEGMDQKELELIDTLSQHSNSVPQTPLSPSPSSILENILQSESPQTPLAMKDELFRMKSSLTTSVKKNDHMTALLRECEANSSRLSEQAIVLKEEIRRLERNEKREQDLLNMEYLKNVIIKFLKVGSDEREQLIPVLCTMLKLSEDEKKFVVEYAKGEGDDDDDEHNKTWSSYVYRWTSLS